MRRRILVAICCASLLIALSGSAAHSQACAHPYPCGNEWPDGLEGPFDLRELRHVRVPSHDGTLLDGWLALPAVPEGVGAPAVLISTPYIGGCNVAHPQCAREPDDPKWDPLVSGYWGEWEPGLLNAADVMGNSLGFPLMHLIRRGYAVALFNVRGTGNAGGCFELGGTAEQLDQAHLVEWVAAQDWSNERVAMGGLSYGSFTAWQAAVHDPPHLITTVTAGEVSNISEFFYTPQGARSARGFEFLPAYQGSYALGVGMFSTRTDWVGRACSDAVAAALTNEPLSYANGVRPEAFWEERRLIDDMPSVTSASLSAHGFWDTDHGFQDGLMWGALPAAPKRFLRGWWGHEFPSAYYDAVYSYDVALTTLNPAWSEPDWESIVFRWLEYWLKGRGTPGRIGMTDYQDEAQVWHETTDWEGARDEVAYLSSTSLTPPQGGTSRTFRSAPPPADQVWTTWGYGVSPQASLCAERDPLTDRLVATYTTEPASDDVVIAGNPFAYLRLSSDMSGGLATVQVFDLPPDFSCLEPESSGAAWLASGSADLRYHATFFEPRAFPLNSPTNVRIDLSDVAARIEQGHRLAIVVGHGEAGDRIPRPGDYPEITVHADGGALASHVVLPIVEGSFGGAGPTLEYPPRPFQPD